MTTTKLFTLTLLLTIITALGVQIATCENPPKRQVCEMPVVGV